MDKRLLTILRCPVTHKGLSLLKKDKLEKINAAIEDGKVETHEGKSLDTPLAEALVTDDGKRVYPVAEGIPVVLVDPGWVRTDMGGTNAAENPLGVARGVLDIAARLSLTDTGKFFRFTGEERAF